MQTTLRLPDDLYREAKSAAAREGISLTQLLMEAIALRLGRRTTGEPWEIPTSSVHRDLTPAETMAFVAAAQQTIEREDDAELVRSNVLSAAFLPGHVHHDRAVQDLHELRSRSETVLLHPLVLAAFLRLTTTSHLGIPPATPKDCMAFVRSLYQHLAVAPFHERPDQLEAFGISGGFKRGMARLFMSHPPLEERIAALQRSTHA